jgi:Histidine kinase/Two component regulator propeller
VQVHAQNPVFKNLSVANNFPSDVIYDIYQSKNGVLWIASAEGLIRHSGSATDLYIPQNTTSRGLSNIMEGADGVIWCQNFSGQFLYIHHDSLLLATFLPSNGNFKSASMLDHQTLAYCASGNIILYHTKDNTIQKIAIDTKSYSPFISTNENESRLFSNTKNNIMSINKMGIIKTNKFNSSSAQLFYATRFANQDLFFSKTQPIICQYKNNTSAEKFSTLLQNKLLNNIKKIDNQSVALLSSAGFYLADSNLEIGENYLPTENTSSIIKDNNGNIWVGTLSNGIYIIPNLQLKKYYDGTSFTCTENDGKINIVGDEKNNILFLNNTDLQTQKKITDPILHTIKCIFKNPYKNEVLYCNYNLNQFNTSTNKNTRSNLSVNAIAMADSTHYLLSESNCVSIYPISQNDKWKAWLADSSRSISNNRLVLNAKNGSRAMYATMVKDTIYASTGNALWQFYKSGSKTLLWNNKNINALQLHNINNKLIIATSQDGVLQYENGIVSSFIKPNNIVGKNEIYAVKIFDNKIFVLLYSGLDVYDIAGKKLKNIVRSDGFIDIDITDFVVKNNIVTATTINGIITFPLDASIAKKNVPSLLIRRLYVNQKQYDLQENLSFTHKQKFVEIEIEDLDYLGIKANALYYKVNDGEWINFKNNKITFNELAPNDYTISFKAINERGIVSVNNPILHFVILAPFYKRTWFILLSAIGLIALMMLGFRYRIQQIESKNKLLTDKINLEKALHKSTLASIKSQMNPHFIFNALNTIQSYIYLNDKKTASDFLVQFSELTRLILDNSNQEKILISEELKAITLYLKLEKMRFEDDFEYEIDSNQIANEPIKIPSMLIQPYIENAIKHGLLHKVGLKKLSVKFEIINNIVLVSIEDNGIGIIASTQINKQKNTTHHSFATKANQKRFELLNELNENNIGVEIISLQNNLLQATGTKVILSIPF